MEAPSPRDGDVRDNGRDNDPRGGNRPESADARADPRGRPFPAGGPGGHFDAGRAPQRRPRSRSRDRERGHDPREDAFRGANRRDERGGPRPDGRGDGDRRFHSRSRSPARRRRRDSEGGDHRRGPRDHGRDTARDRGRDRDYRGSKRMRTDSSAWDTRAAEPTSTPLLSLEKYKASRPKGSPAAGGGDGSNDGAEGGDGGGNDIEAAYARYCVEHYTRDAKALFALHRMDEWVLSRYDAAEVVKRADAGDASAVAEAAAMLAEAESGTLSGDTVQRGAFFPVFGDVSLVVDAAAPNAKGQHTVGDESTLYVRPFASELPRDAFVAACSALPGAKRVLVGGPRARGASERFRRCGWVSFGSKEEAEAAKKELASIRLKLPSPAAALDELREVAESVAAAAADAKSDVLTKGAEYLAALPKKPSPTLRGTVAALHPRTVSLACGVARPQRARKLPKGADARVADDLELATSLAEALDREHAVVAKTAPGRIRDLLSKDAVSSLEEAQRLDVVLLYLRRVHNYCLYAGLQCADAGELVHAASVGYSRRPAGDSNSGGAAAASAAAGAGGGGGGDDDDDAAKDATEGAVKASGDGDGDDDDAADDAAGSDGGGDNAGEGAAQAESTTPAYVAAAEARLELAKARVDVASSDTAATNVEDVVAACKDGAAESMEASAATSTQDPFVSLLPTGKPFGGADGRSRAAAEAAAATSVIDTIMAAIAEADAQSNVLLTKFFNAHVKQEKKGDEKRRCGLCRKLFKSRAFVEKHLRNKHTTAAEEAATERREKVREAVEFLVRDALRLRAYLADEGRPMPLTKTPQSRGDKGRDRDRGARGGGSFFGGGRQGFPGSGGPFGPAGMFMPMGAAAMMMPMAMPPPPFPMGGAPGGPGGRGGGRGRGAGYRSSDNAVAAAAAPPTPDYERSLVGYDDL